jgi:hypothetical protein
MLLRLPSEILLLISDSVCESALSQCCHVLRDLLKYRHIILQNYSLSVVYTVIAQTVRTLSYYAVRRLSSHFPSLVSALHVLQYLPLLEGLHACTSGEHITLGSVQGLPSICNKYLSRLAIRLTGVHVEPGALCILLNTFAHGSLSKLQDVVLDLQPKVHIDPEDMKCLYLLTSPCLGIQSLTLLLADTTWDGDRLLVHCYPHTRVCPQHKSRLRSFRIHLDDTSVTDWGMKHAIPSLLRLHPHLEAFALNVNGGELSSGVGLQTLVRALCKHITLRGLELHLSRCDLPDTSVLAKLRCLSRLEKLCIDLSENPSLYGRTAVGLQHMLSPSLISLNLNYIRTQIPDLDFSGLHLRLSSLEALTLKVLRPSCPGILSETFPLSLKSLRLDIARVRLGGPSCHCLGRGLRQFACLRRLFLDMHNTLLRDIGLCTLVRAIMSLPELHNIDLRLQCNLITHCGVQSILTLVQSPLLTDIRIDLSDNPLGFLGTTAIVSWAILQTRKYLLILLHNVYPLCDVEESQVYRMVPPHQRHLLLF